MVTRRDNWMSVYTGLGYAERDKAQSIQFVSALALSDQQLENLYHGEDMAALIVDALVEDAMAKGYYLSAEGLEEDLNKGLIEEEERLGFRKHLKANGIWARNYGGSCIYVGLDDGLEEDEPVDLNRIKKIDFLMTLDKRSLQQESAYEERNSTKFGETELYRLNTSGDQTGSLIHETRLLRMDGALTSENVKDKNGGWSDSVLKKVYDTLLKFDIGWSATSHILQDAQQAIFKMKNLTQMISSNDKDLLQSRMEVVEKGRSVARAIMLDADSEDFTRQDFSFSGVPDVLKMFILRLSAAAKIPVVRLMGQSPAGLNATGESDMRLWYDRVKSYQEDDLSPIIRRFYELVFASQAFMGERPETFDIKFNRLKEMSDQEQADLEKKVAEKDKIYIDSQVLLPEEVAVNRFGRSEFSMETHVDLDVRQEMMQAELALARSKAGEEPDPMPVVEPVDD